jgi:hypothetical protein
MKRISLYFNTKEELRLYDEIKRFAKEERFGMSAAVIHYVRNLQKQIEGLEEALRFMKTEIEIHKIITSVVPDEVLKRVWDELPGDRFHKALEQIRDELERTRKKREGEN